MKIAILNGPNLNLTGSREKDIYGSVSWEQFFQQLQDRFPDIQFTFFQSNVEGILINKLQEFSGVVEAIIFNPGGYTHTSVALGDTVAAIPCPVIEVHISNIFAREVFRKISHISAQCKGTITGFGLEGYALAVYAIMNRKLV